MKSTRGLAGTLSKDGEPGSGAAWPESRPQALRQNQPGEDPPHSQGHSLCPPNAKAGVAASGWGSPRHEPGPGREGSQAQAFSDS